MDRQPTSPSPAAGARSPSPSPAAGARSPSPSGREGVYVISVAAELAGVHPQTLRIYERRGLLDPERTSGGSRRYSQADLARLERIVELTASGLNLEGVKRVMDLEDEVQRLQEQIDGLNQRYRRDLVPYRMMHGGK